MPCGRRLWGLTAVLGCTKCFLYVSMLFFRSCGSKREARKFVNNTLGSHKDPAPKHTPALPSWPSPSLAWAVPFLLLLPLHPPPPLHSPEQQIYFEATGKIQQVRCNALILETSPPPTSVPSPWPSPLTSPPLSFCPSTLAVVPEIQPGKDTHRHTN